MLFGLTEDHVALRDTARAFAADKLAPHALEWDERKHFPVEVIREAADLGMGGVYVREECRRIGADAARRGADLRGAGDGLPDDLGLHLDPQHGRLDDRPLRLGRAAAALAAARCARWSASRAYCLTEPGSGSDAAALRTSARRDGDHYVLDGSKQFISGAGAGDLYVVMVRTGEDGPTGISTFVVEGDAPGLSFGPNERKMGWNAQPTRQIIFEDCRVPVANRLGAEGIGFRIAMAGLDGGRLNIGACSLGGAQAALDKALAYMRERKAFGKRLDEFQALQFRLADMATELEAARTFLYARRRRPRPARRRTRPCAAPWPSASPPMSASRSRTRRCSSTAATATWPNTASRRSSATCGCTRSWRAPTRSCA